VFNVMQERHRGRDDFEITLALGVEAVKQWGVFKLNRSRLKHRASRATGHELGSLGPHEKLEC
jgi:hypothetical protein